MLPGRTGPQNQHLRPVPVILPVCSFCKELLQIPHVTGQLPTDSSFSSFQEKSSTKIENAAFTFPQIWYGKETVLTGALRYFLLGIFCSKLHKSAPLKNKSRY